MKRGAPQLDVQELEVEQQPAPQELVRETQEALSERESRLLAMAVIKNGDQ